MSTELQRLEKVERQLGNIVTSLYGAEPISAIHAREGLAGLLAETINLLRDLLAELREDKAGPAAPDHPAIPTSMPSKPPEPEASS